MNFIDHFDSVLSLSEGQIPVCSGCLKKVQGDELKSCSGCLKAKYCSRACQKKHWKVHKKVCSDAKTLRFQVADRVRISVGGEWDPWKKGMIIGLYMFSRKNYPYSIMCDDGSLMHAPEDSDIYIQKLDDEALVLCNKDGKPLTPLPVPRSPAEVRAAELRNEALFREAPPEDDCPLCGLRFPMKSETMYRK